MKKEGQREERIEIRREEGEKENERERERGKHSIIHGYNTFILTYGPTLHI